MNDLKFKMKAILNVFDKFDRKKMIINVYSNRSNDFKHFTDSACIYYAGGVQKKSCKAIIKTTYSKFDHSADLNIEFSSYQSDKNEIKFDKSKLLSHRLIKIIFYINDFQVMHNVYSIFIDWAKNRKIQTNSSPTKLTMVIPPDSKNNKIYMRQYMKFCQENQTWFQYLKERK